MAYELVREKIVLDQKIGKETSQVLLEGDLIVPDVKPDMAVILQTDAKVCIDRADAAGDRISFSGKLDVQVLYLAKGSEKPVHSMSVTAPIDDFINMEGVTKDMWVEVKAELTNIEYKMQNDRKINYRAVVDVAALCESTNEHDIVVNISDVPDNQLLKSSLTLNRRVENKTDRFTITDELLVPAGKPNIREVLQCGVAVANKEVRVTAGRVTVSGELVVTTLYRGDSDSSLIEFMEHEMPFNGGVDISGVREDMMADVVLHIQDHTVQAKPDSDGEERVLAVEAVVGVAVKAHCQDTLEILRDAYCIGKNLELSKTPIKYPKLICRNKNQTPVKEVVQLGEGCPDILQIFRVKGRACVDEAKIIEDKVIVEGVIEADALYVAEDDQAPLYSFHTTLPYRQIIETKGAAAGMDAEMDVSIDHVGFNMLSGREMELRFLLSFNTQVIHEMEMSMVTDIAFADMDRAVVDGMASMTVYVVQKDDSLWSIAKRYNTSIDELLSVNDIENPNKIVPGHKLLILKKVS